MGPVDPYCDACNCPLAGDSLSPYCSDCAKRIAASTCKRCGGGVTFPTELCPVCRPATPDIHEADIREGGDLTPDHVCVACGAMCPTTSRYCSAHAPDIHEDGGRPVAAGAKPAEGLETKLRAAGFRSLNELGEPAPDHRRHVVALALVRFAATVGRKVPRFYVGDFDEALKHADRLLDALRGMR